MEIIKNVPFQTCFVRAFYGFRVFYFSTYVLTIYFESPYEFLYSFFSRQAFDNLGKWIRFSEENRTLFTTYVMNCSTYHKIIKNDCISIFPGCTEQKVSTTSTRGQNKISPVQKKWYIQSMMWSKKKTIDFTIAIFFFLKRINCLLIR